MHGSLSLFGARGLLLCLPKRKGKSYKYQTEAWTVIIPI